MACSPVPKVGGAAAPSAPPVPTPLDLGSDLDHGRSSGLLDSIQDPAPKFKKKLFT